jgi:hypothetical protein
VGLRSWAWLAFSTRLTATSLTPSCPALQTFDLRMMVPASFPTADRDKPIELDRDAVWIGPSHPTS